MRISLRLRLKMPVDTAFAEIESFSQLADTLLARSAELTDLSPDARP
jgi:hypothetical protein